MDVVDHEEGGNRASFDAAVGYGSAAVQRVAVFLVKSFFGKSNGARIAVDGFQIDRAESGENVFRAVRAVLVMRNDDRALIGDGVDGIFQKIAFSEKSVIERKSADEDEKYAEKTEWVRRKSYQRCFSSLVIFFRNIFAVGTISLLCFRCITIPPSRYRVPPPFTHGRLLAKPTSLDKLEFVNSTPSFGRIDKLLKVRLKACLLYTQL